MPVSTPREAKYYVRMRKDGVWYFLLRTAYDKKRKCMAPIWWPEHMRGVSKPFLYKSLVSARNAQDRYVSPIATHHEVAVWNNL